MFDEIKKVLKTSSFIWQLRCFFSFRVTGGNRIKLKGRANKIKSKKAIITNSFIQISGNNNIIEIGAGSRFSGEVKIFGNNNVVHISDNCIIKNPKFWVEDNGNRINIGGFTTIEGNTELACIEGCNITIGDDCMLSSDIIIRTGDSHSILDGNEERINRSADIRIEDHVWIGQQAVITKGAKVSKNSIVGFRALVNKRFDTTNCIIAGIPGKIIKEGTNWKRERIR